MIRVEALEQVTTKHNHLFTEEELNLAASEGDRFLGILPKIPKNVPYREVVSFLRQYDFLIMSVLDDDTGKWAGYRNVVEIISTNVPETVPGIYIVALITTQLTEIPYTVGNGDRLYLRS